MRADVLLLALAVLVTGCASVSPTPRPGTSLRYTERPSPAPEWMHSPREEVPPTQSSSRTSLATSRERERMARHRNVREKAAGEGSRGIAGAVGGSLAHRDTRQDAWENLLVGAGLDDQDARPLAVGGMTPTQAARLLGQLIQKPVTLGNFPPRMAASFLLREVMEGGEVPRQELLRRVERFSQERVAVLRPDGYLAWALTGNTQQKVAPVEWKDGAFRAHGFELGRFYSGKGGVFRKVDAQLQPSDWRPLAEVYSDADVIGRSLDGAQDAFVELYHALGQALSRPMDSLMALSNLPAGVGALITSSPAYWERFRYMTQGEQIREVSRLATSFIATWGAASVTTRTLKGMAAGVEATVPVLSLSVQGALVIERVSVPLGRAVSVLSGGPGAAIILQRTGAGSGQPSSPGEQGPGRWETASESMSEASRKYQAQVTEAPTGKVYKVQEVKFDGFKMGVLLETKGPGYSRFLKDGSFRTWFRGADGMLEQAKRQFKAAKGTPIQWHFAEREVADAVRDLFRNEGLGTIKVVFTPPAP